MTMFEGAAAAAVKSPAVGLLCLGIVFSLL